MPIEPGIKLGSYEVQEFIGQGAMGLVYRAYHEQLERSAAVKVLQGIAADPDAAARFRHEAQAIAQMRHPNIVNVYDFGAYEGTPYMIVEYVPGGNLATRMEQTPMDQASALECLRGIGAGLDYAHSMGIVHRDVKPGNVLLEKDGSPVLADFGLVKLLQGSSVQSMTGVTTGTPAYMAPEQVTGHDVGPAADRYSLATMAYEMLTGTIPFDGEGVLELLYAHVHRDPPPPSSRNAALSGSVDAVIMRGLAKDPDARWESCAAFIEALTAALASAPVTVTATMPMVREKPAARVAPAPYAATVAMAMPSTPPPKVPRQRRRAFEIVAGVVILLLLLLAGGICAAASQKPTLTLNPVISVPGGSVTVIASHVPANQVGQIVMRSQPVAFPFQSGANGNVNEIITVPANVGIGDHTVDLCWGGSCHVQRILHVVALGDLPSPTPSSNPSPTTSGSPTTKPTAGKSPSPGASPTARPSSSPTPRPRSTPTSTRSPSPSSQPTPIPSSNPCPTPTAGPTLTPNPGTVVGGGKVQLAGSNFTPNKQVTLNYYLGNATIPSQTWTTTVACNGTFSTSVTTASGLARTDRVRACDTLGRCAVAKITVLI